MPSNETTIASEVIAASLGGAISASILYPLEVLKTKMQAEKEDNTTEDEDGVVEKKTMLEYASHLYKTEGPRVFLHGFETSAFQSAAEKALYFFSYTILKEGHSMMTGSSELGTFSNLLLGYMADWMHLPITLPMDCWTTQIQTSKEAPMKILLNVLAGGPSKMYKGIQAYVVLCLKPAIQYTVFEQVKMTVLKDRSRQKQSLSAVEAFVLGMIARTVATVAVFPYLRAKVVLQTEEDNDDDDTQEKKSVMVLLGKMYAKGGLSSWFQGLGPELTRGIFSAALMLMIKEQLADLVKATLAGKKQQLVARNRVTYRA